jgi:hypothetical protein
LNLKTKILSLTVFGMLAIGGAVVLGAGTAQAYQGDYSKTGPNYSVARETAMEAVMKNKDYDGWKKLMTEDGRNPGVLRKVDTKEKFEKFAQAYELGKAGRTTEANVIRAELGLGNGMGQGRGGNGNGGRGGCMD